MIQVLLEALVVGLVLAVIVTVLKTVVKIDLNNLYILIPSMILIGSLVHIGFEITGGNAYYCEYGSACQ